MCNVSDWVKGQFVPGEAQTTREVRHVFKMIEKCKKFDPDPLRSNNGLHRRSEGRM